MSTHTSQLHPTAAVPRWSRLSPTGILLLGVIAIPLALTVALNSYGPLSEESAIRMAFATVAGQTIAVLSAVASLAITLSRRPHPAAIAVFVIIAAVVTLAAIGGMASAGELMLNNLELVAETNLLNR